jgi:hypothetical protein
MLAAAHVSAQSRQSLDNGIVLPEEWPPRWQMPNDHPVEPGYIAQPPAVIPIDVGRQLFVDDFLIAETNLYRRCHKATYFARNPVLAPTEPWEIRDEYADRTATEPNPTAMAFSDGIFFDPRERIFKMWYMGGYQMATCLATSHDGITWEKPRFDVIPGTNIVLDMHRDASTVWLDLNDSVPTHRYKLAAYRDERLLLFTSSDGIHWRGAGATPRTGDRTTFFYNPFRKVWVFGIRADESTTQISGRYRRYFESPAFEGSTDWHGRPPVAWVKADSRDFVREGTVRAELYNLDCVAYESVLLGLFTIWRGEAPHREKINEVCAGFSRDGFHFVRPDREAILPVSEKEGSWNWANVQSAGGCCLLVGDELYFYVSGRQGRPGTQAPGVCSTGLARLRRDGFVSMDWLPGEHPLRRDRHGNEHGVLTTRPVRFSGAHLFVNADLNGGELRVEMLNERGEPLANFRDADAVPVRGNGTRLPVTWRQHTLASLAGTPVRFRFRMTRGRLFAFWVSAWPSGESGGYVAAGGPAFSATRDVPA